VTELTTIFFRELEPNKKMIYDQHGTLVGVGSLWPNERPMKTHKRFPKFESSVTLVHGKINCNETKKIDDPTTMLGEFEVPKP
jgi:hypothetical protein